MNDHCLLLIKFKYAINKLLIANLKFEWFIGLGVNSSSGLTYNELAEFLTNYFQLP